MITRIVSDSSCDIWNIEGTDFRTAPLTISTEERSFRDDENLNIDEMIAYLKGFSGPSHTACPNVQDWMDAYAGADEIYVVCMTSTLSGTYNSAVIAKDMYLEEHPDAKIQVFDTLSTSSEQLLFIEKIAEKIKENQSFEQICEEMKTYLNQTRIFFAFQSLHNLAQNGRVNKIVASTVGVLGLSILGTGSPEGTLNTTGKARGDKRTIQKLRENFLEAGYQGGKMRICHIKNEKLANELANEIKKDFPNADIKIYPSRGLIAYYGEEAGIIIGIEK